MIYKHFVATPLPTFGNHTPGRPTGEANVQSRMMPHAARPNQ